MEQHPVHVLCEMHALIRGEVQGVGFRATTQYYAMRLGLKGTVRNLPNGNVEIYAQGSKQQLQELIRKLKEEFGSRQIEEATVEYLSMKNPYRDFQIIH